MNQRTADQKLYKVSWRNKKTGVEGYEDFVQAKNMVYAIDAAKRAIRRDGHAETDILITEIAVRA